MQNYVVYQDLINQNMIIENPLLFNQNLILDPNNVYSQQYLQQTHIQNNQMYQQQQLPVFYEPDITQLYDNGFLIKDIRTGENIVFPYQMNLQQYADYYQLLNIYFKDQQLKFKSQISQQNLLIHNLNFNFVAMKNLINKLVFSNFENKEEFLQKWENFKSYPPRMDIDLQDQVNTTSPTNKKTKKPKNSPKNNKKVDNNKTVINDQTVNESVVNQTVDNQTVDNQTFDNQTDVNQTFDNQTDVNEQIVNNTLISDEIINQIVENEVKIEELKQVFVKKPTWAQILKNEVLKQDESTTNLEITNSSYEEINVSNEEVVDSNVLNQNILNKIQEYKFLKLIQNKSDEEVQQTLIHLNKNLNDNFLLNLGTKESDIVNDELGIFLYSFNNNNSRSSKVIKIVNEFNSTNYSTKQIYRDMFSSFTKFNIETHMNSFELMSSMYLKNQHKLNKFVFIYSNKPIKYAEEYIQSIRVWTSQKFDLMFKLEEFGPLQILTIFNHESNRLFFQLLLKKHNEEKNDIIFIWY